MALNLFRWKRAADRGLPYHGMRPHEFATGPVESPDDAERILHVHVQDYIPSYRDRVRQLVAMCRDAETTPVLVTQPTLYGDVVDDVTGVDLATIQVPELTDKSHSTVSGATHWRIVQEYNDVLRELATSERVALIDLAEKMPKSSTYFYDWIHFTNQGVQQVAEIIWDDFREMLVDVRSG